MSQNKQLCIFDSIKIIKEIDNMKEDLRKYLKDTFHVTHKGFVKYFLLRTSGEALPIHELVNEVGCCYQSIEKWDETLEELGIIYQEGIRYYRYIDGDRVAIGQSEYYTYNRYNQIADMYRTLLDLAPYGIEKASKRLDINSEGIELAEIFSNLLEGLQAIDMPLTNSDFAVTIAPVFEVCTDNDVYMTTMVMIAKYSSIVE